MRRLLRRLRSRLAPDPDVGYRWYTCGYGPMGAGETWDEVGFALKLGPVTFFDYLGFRGVAVLNRWVWERGSI